jgi:hypothetical protein
MKKTLVALAAVLLLFGSTALYGVDQTSTSEIELTGVVFAVEPANNQIIIKVTENGKLKNTRFLVTEDTTVSTADGSQVLLEEVKMGDEVVVRFTKIKKKNYVRSLQVGS